jgi:hypothetical protein
MAQNSNAPGSYGSRRHAHSTPNVEPLTRQLLAASQAEGREFEPRRPLWLKRAQSPHASLAGSSGLALRSPPV